MSVKIEDNTNKVILQIQRQASLAVRYMLDDVHQISTPVTPRDKGYLRRNVMKSVIGLKGSIKWGQKYASRQESGRRIRNYTTAGTGPHYAENSVRSVAKSPQNAMRKARLI